MLALLLSLVRVEGRPCSNFLASTVILRYLDPLSLWDACPFQQASV